MMTPGLDRYVSARHRDNALRVVVRDQHQRHADPDTVTLCGERRRSALWLLDSVADDRGGELGPLRRGAAACGDQDLGSAAQVTEASPGCDRT